MTSEALVCQTTRCLWAIPVRKLDGTCIYRAQLYTSLAWKTQNAAKITPLQKRRHSPDFAF